MGSAMDGRGSQLLRCDGLYGSHLDTVVAPARQGVGLWLVGDSLAPHGTGQWGMSRIGTGPEVACAAGRALLEVPDQARFNEWIRPESHPGDVWQGGSS